MRRPSEEGGIGHHRSGSGGSPVHRSEPTEGVALRGRRNWRIFAAFARKEYPECLVIIEEQLRACNGLAEYPIYVKGQFLLNDAATCTLLSLLLLSSH